MEMFYGKLWNYQRVSDGIIVILPRSPFSPLQVSFNLLGLHPVTAMVQLEFDHLLDTMVASLQLQGPGTEGVALTEANLRKLNDQRRLRRPSVSSWLHWWNMIDKKMPYSGYSTCVQTNLYSICFVCVCFFEGLSWHRFLDDYLIWGTINMFAIVFCSTVFGTKHLVS